MNWVKGGGSRNVSGRGWKNLKEGTAVTGDLGQGKNGSGYHPGLEEMKLGIGMGQRA